MSHHYMVHCLIHPRSGFELAAKNKIMRHFKEAMKAKIAEDFRIMEDVESAEQIMEHLDRFEKDLEGMVLETFVIETDAEVTDAEKEILPEIQKKHPGAVLFNCEKMYTPSAF